MKNYILLLNNKEIRERKEKKLARKNKLVRGHLDSFIKVEEHLEDSDFDFTKLFSPSYYKDISAFKKNFIDESIDLEWGKNKIMEITSKNNKVFNYSQKGINPKPVILSRNIIDHISSKKISPSEKCKMGNGWTKIFKFFSDESLSLNYSVNKEKSFSMTNAWEKDEERKYLTDRNFDIDLSQTSSKMRMKEAIKKYSIETQDSKDKSTNLATTVEAASSEKNRVTIVPIKKANNEEEEK